MMFRRNKFLMQLILLALSCGLLFVSFQCSEQAQVVTPDTVSILVTGDALMSLPWSNYNEPEFTGLIDEVRNADVAMTNLEMLLHTFDGYGQANSGGTYMGAEPEIADELVWAGFDMAGHANNHTFDYGSYGVLETLKYARQAGLKIAGSGKDLQEARTPVYYSSAGGRIALLSTSTSFTAYGRASRSRPDLHGRPGLNPLTVERQYSIDRPAAQRLYRAASASGIGVENPTGDTFRMFGRNFIVGDSYAWKYVIDEEDLMANIDAVREADARADWVVMSFHSHQREPDKAQTDLHVEFARQCIDNGVDIFFTHGHHYMKGIEIYKGRPIFYGLGNFVFQNETIKKQPVEFYNRYGLGDDATPDEVYDARTTTERGVDTRGFPSQRRYWESVVSVVQFKDGKLDHIRLLPITLQLGTPRGIRGRPLLADKDHGRYIIEKLQELSEPFGTVIKYDSDKNIGIIDFE